MPIKLALLTVTLCAVVSLGCTKPSAQVTAIEVSGIRNLPPDTVRVADPKEIARIVALTRGIPDEIARVYTTRDAASARVARMRLVYADRHDDYTLSEDFIQIPGDSRGMFYSRNNQNLAQLWAFVLAALGSEMP